MSNKIYPIVNAIVDGKDIKMYCKYCDIWHIHGLGGGEGHRVAHCQKDTPYKSTGYILKITKEE